jgi:hypothetical protein
MAKNRKQVFYGLIWQILPLSRLYPFLGDAMTTMNISLPETLKDFVDTQVQEQGGEHAKPGEANKRQIGTNISGLRIQAFGE